LTCYGKAVDVGAGDGADVGPGVDTDAGVGVTDGGDGVGEAEASLILASSSNLFSSR